MGNELEVEFWEENLRNTDVPLAEGPSSSLSL